MKRSIISVNDIEEVLLRYHKNRGYRLFNTFPIVSDDPTVMFINATITPFKHFYSSGSKTQRCNYAFTQRCFRLGGASELEVVGVISYYHTFFEMFGSGTFGISHQEAIKYLLELFTVLGIEKQRIYYTIPSSEDFRSALIANGVKKNHVFTLKSNTAAFWQEWRFGKMGPIGYGLTAIYSRSSGSVGSVDQMASDIDQFVPFLCLVYVGWKETNDGRIFPVTNPGFDLGVGIERLAAALQECNTYQIDAIAPLVEVVTRYLNSITSRKIKEEIIRIVVDHLRAICVLIDEGVLPSNKRHGYALRKLIRRILELIWVSTGEVVSIEGVIEDFYDYLTLATRPLSISVNHVIKTIENETSRYITAIQKALQILERQPNISPDALRSTFGLPPPLIPIFSKKGVQTNPPFFIFEYSLFCYILYYFFPITNKVLPLPATSLLKHS